MQFKNYSEYSETEISTLVYLVNGNKATFYIADQGGSITIKKMHSFKRGEGIIIIGEDVLIVPVEECYRFVSIKIREEHVNYLNANPILKELIVKDLELPLVIKQGYLIRIFKSLIRSEQLVEFKS